MPEATSPTTAVRRDELPLAGRSMELRGFTRAVSDDAQADTPLATASLVFTTGAPVRRYDWYRDRHYMERLLVEPSAIRLERLQRGAPLLNTHNQWDLEAQLGVVENLAISGGEGTCDVTFSRRPSVAGFVQDVQDRVIRNVSVGYARHRVEMVAPADENGIWEYRVTDWEPMEVSLVPIPADLDSQVRSGSAPQTEDGQQIRTFPCEFIEIRSTPSQPAAGSTAAPTEEGNRSMPDATQAQGGTTPAAAPAAAPAASAAPAATPTVDTRAADISDLCQRHGVPHLVSEMIRSGTTVDAARAQVLDELARRDAAAGGHQNTVVETVRDETETRMAGLQEALLHRVDPSAQLTDNGRQYRGMSLVELGRDMLERAGRSARGMTRLEVTEAMLQLRSPGMQGTSDFSFLLSNVATRRLRASYEQAGSTYTLWARRAPNAADFKSIDVVQLSGAPELLRTNEHGEFKYGTLTDAGESYKVVTYGRIVSLTRQAIVNDDLRGFDRLIGAFGDSAARLENRLVYSQIIDNPTMGDGKALFHADHGNLGTTGTVLDNITKLGDGRKAMRKQKGMQNEPLNLAPAFLIVPSDLEQIAYQFTSSNYQPTTPGEVNEFRQGGRTALAPIVEPLLDGNSTAAWYLAANSNQVDTVEFCYLDGAEGPVIETKQGFEVDGVAIKCRLDFGAKAVDWRGLRKATGQA
jgi:hypothetical protein